MNQDQYVARGSAIRDLFKRAFGRDQVEEFLIWRYAANAGGDPEVRVRLVEEERQVLAHYGSSAVEFSNGTDALRGALVGAAMTDPALQGKGVFQRLAREHEQELRGAGYDFLFAFPHPARRTDNIFLWKLGWKPVYDIPTQIFELSKPVQSPEAQLSFDDDFTRFRYDELTDRAGLFAAKRTAEYLRWRYSKNPVNDYRNLVLANGDRLYAYVVLKFFRSDGELYADAVDFFAFEPAALSTIFLQVLAFSKDAGCRAVSLWSPRHHVARHELARIGFGISLPVTYLSYRPLNQRADTQLSSFSNWWITMGDSDVY